MKLNPLAIIRNTLFEGTPFTSAIHLTFAGLPVISMDYLSTVIPVIFVVYFASKVERFFDRIVPAVVKFFFVPMLTVLIASIVGLLLIGPVTTFGATLISEGVRACAPSPRWSRAPSSAARGRSWSSSASTGASSPCTSTTS